jgi:hypothetical protein
MGSSFQEHYASISDDELLHIAGDRRDLREEAVVALDAEMSRRGFTRRQARIRKTDELRSMIAEAGSHRQKRKRSRYFVAKMNRKWLLIGLAGIVVFFLLVEPHPPSDPWLQPGLVVYLGCLMACLGVQPWVRGTVSFWVSLAISSTLQFMVARWLIVYHPAHSRQGDKGLWFLSTFSGYVVGGAVFLLLQELKRRQTPTPRDDSHFNRQFSTPDSLGSRSKRIR